MKKLAKEIDKFLKKHAKDKADYDPDYDEELERYASPDASELASASKLLKEGKLPARSPWSEWGSGGYSPYLDKEARRWHDELIKKIGMIL